MVGKHINKRKRTSSEDEWAHIANISNEESHDVKKTDAMDIQDRTIDFSQTANEPTTNFDFYKEEKEKVKDEFGNTAQYIKFINERFKEKKDKIDSIYEKQKKFDDEIDALQGYKPKSREKLNQIKYKDIKAVDIERTLHYLEKDREVVNKKMEHFATQISHSQMDLIEKDKQIAEIKAEMQIALKREAIDKQKEEEPIEVLKNHLQNIGNSEESKKILKALGSHALEFKNNDSVDIQSFLKRLTQDE